MKRALPYLLLAPAVIVYLTFSLIPLYGIFRLSLFRTNFVRSRFVGLKNYVDMFQDPLFFGALGNSILYVVLSVPLHLAMSLGVALLIYNTSEKWQTFSKTTIYLPSFIGAIIMSATWAWIWNPNGGVINQVMGAEVPWFTSRWLSIPPIVLTSTVTGFGGSVVLFSAMLKSVSKASVDAAMIDGAKWYQIKFRVLLPQMYPTIVLVSLLQTAAGFQLYYWIEFLAPYDYAASLMFLMYKTAFTLSKWGAGSARAVVLMFVILAVAMAQRAVMRRGKQ